MSRLKKLSAILTVCLLGGGTYAAEGKAMSEMGLCDDVAGCTPGEVLCGTFSVTVYGVEVKLECTGQETET